MLPVHVHNRKLHSMKPTSFLHRAENNSNSIFTNIFIFATYMELPSLNCFHKKAINKPSYHMSESLMDSDSRISDKLSIFHGAHCQPHHYLSPVFKKAAMCSFEDTS